MDLTQRKLNKSEWESIEVPVSQEEKDILQLITNGYKNVNIKYNKSQSLFTFLNIEYGLEMEDFLYNKYFSNRIKTIKNKNNSTIECLNIDVNGQPKIKKADMIRLEKNDISKMPKVYEILLIDTIENLFNSKIKNKTDWLFYYFTLYKLNKNTISLINRHIKKIVENILFTFEDEIDMFSMIEKSVEYLEKNELLLKYADMSLYEHQKEIFAIMQNNYSNNTINRSGDAILPKKNPKLILYIAPTGTGKTLTPIGLSESFRVIFVCAARHIGLALAKSAISVGKKIAFAFGCSSADEIRLHYSAAKEFKKNKKTGGIGKVDNSVGDKVEIIICDVRSYLCAMYYMLAFNQMENIVVCWDEPTITMDYDNHELHAFINKNWRENLIPNMVLSSATLPKLQELTDTISNFKSKFPEAEIHNIISHDCKKSIPIINKNGYVVLPHTLSQDYDIVLNIMKHCENNLTLLRYFDLKEVTELIAFVEKNNYIQSNMKINRHFTSLDDINMKNIKLHYLRVLSNIKGGTWGAIWASLSVNRQKRILSNNSIDEKGNTLRKISSFGSNFYSNSNLSQGKPIVKTMSEQILSATSSPTISQETGNCGIYVTTKDAYTLTDGPTIFLAEDVEKIAKFCIQQASIPTKAMEGIIEKIDFNNKINEKINELEKHLEDLEEKNSKGLENCKYSKKENELEYKVTSKLNIEIDTLRSMIKPAELNETFVPNKLLHLKKWAETFDTKKSFTSDIDEDTVIEIMMLKNVEDSWKILLLMGIGVFTNHTDTTYTEIMKKLTDQQKLYMIIASSDYIYGTNYQFCHGYLSKDMILTQEKMIQALGRIGRNNIQQTYSIRLRDDEQIKKLFYEEKNKPEVKNMNLLFSDNVFE